MTFPVFDPPARAATATAPDTIELTGSGIWRRISEDDDGLRSAFALFAESGDHAWRMLEDATLTAMFCLRSATPHEAFDIFDTWHRRAFDEHTRHLEHVVRLQMRMAEAHGRQMRLLMLGG